MLRSLSEIRGLRDPLKQSQIEFVIDDTPGLLIAKLYQKVAGALSGNKGFVDAKTLRLRCTAYSLPGISVKKTELVIANHRRTTGSIQDRSGTFSVSITEDFEGAITNTIQAWADLIHMPMTGLRLPRILYTSTADILFGGGVGGLNPRTIRLKGVYPISYKMSNVNPTSSDPVTLDVEFNYDYFTDPFSLSTLVDSVTSIF